MRGSARFGWLRTAVLIVVGGLLAVPPASGSTGQLTFGDCLTSKTVVTACAPVPGATASSVDAPLTTLYGLAASPDGNSVYAIAGIPAAVVHFQRQPATGALTFASCLTSNTSVDACAKIPGAASSGTNTPLAGLRSVAVSPDGRSLYTAAESGDAVASFSRDPATGALAYQACVGSNTSVPGCTHVPGSTAMGTNSPLGALRSVRLSPDGTSVYAGSGNGDAVASFSRDPATGALAYQACITSNSSVAGCTTIPGAVAGGTNTGLNTIYAVTVSPDGRSLYAAAYNGHGVARFDRAPGGALAYQGCLTTSTAVAGCAVLPGATANGDNTNLGNAIAVEVSADGQSVYAVAEYTAALTHFDRDPATGALTQRECFTTNSSATTCTPLPGAVAGATNTILENLEAVVASADGNNVYVVSYEGAVARFDRDPATGALTYRDCLNADTGIPGCVAIPGSSANAVNSPFHSASSLALSPDGSSLYAGAEGAAAVTRLDRELPPPAVPPDSMPPDVEPSNEFSFAKLKRNKRKGTAKLTVEIPGPGSLVLAGKRLKRAQRPATAAGKLRLVVKAKGKGASKLRRRGKVKLRAKVTYIPTGGAPNTKQRTVKLIRG